MSTTQNQNKPKYIVDTSTLKLVPVMKIYVEVCGKVTYVNAKNSRIFKIFVEETNKAYRCITDVYLPVNEGDALIGRCELEQDPRYGEQLRFKELPFVRLAEDKNSIVKCLIRALRGAGKGSFIGATQILDYMIEKNGNLPNTLALIDRMACHWHQYGDEDVFISYLTVIKDFQLKKLLSWWYKHRILRKLYLFHVNNYEIRTINLPLADVYTRLLNNPYVFPELGIPCGTHGTNNKYDPVVSLLKADKLAKQIGIYDANLGTNVNRWCGEVTRKIYSYMTNKGWVGVPSKIILSLYPQLTNTEILQKLNVEYNMYCDLNTVYLRYPYQVEVGLAEYINLVLKSPSLCYDLPPESIGYIRKKLSPDQVKAIEGALTTNISIISGAAGTGKTTVISEIVHNLVKNNIPYKVVSFTGKAVSRLKEVLGNQQPATMHRLIAMSISHTSPFQHLIIDEVSMVTASLFYEFISKFKFPFKITLVGDINQLPPIGWGHLLNQLLRSKLIPLYTLTHIHRTSQDSDNGIIINATNIITYGDDIDEDMVKPFNLVETPNFRLMVGQLDTVTYLVRSLCDAGIDHDKIVIICPYDKHLAGLNAICQSIYNDNNRSVKDSAGRTWRIKDRVMMTRNMDAINVMNRETGVIVDISASEIKVCFSSGAYAFSLNLDEVVSTNANLETEFTEITVPSSKDGKKIKPKKKTKKDRSDDKLSCNLLKHAFAITVHCAQGSEWPYVILYVPPTSDPNKVEKPTPTTETTKDTNPFAVKISAFLNKNLLYTAITRAKTAIWLVGDISTLNMAATLNQSYRCDNLAQRLINLQTISVR